GGADARGRAVPVDEWVRRRARRDGRDAVDAAQILRPDAARPLAHGQVHRAVERAERRPHPETAAGQLPPHPRLVGALLQRDDHRAHLVLSGSAAAIPASARTAVPSRPTSPSAAAARCASMRAYARASSAAPAPWSPRATRAASTGSSSAPLPRPASATASRTSASRSIARRSGYVALPSRRSESTDLPVTRSSPEASSTSSITWKATPRSSPYRSNAEHAATGRPPARAPANIAQRKRDAVFPRATRR